MPHHFTKATVEAAIWCKRCNKETPWRIADGRRQYCITCYMLDRTATPIKPAPADDKQGDLFNV